MPSDPMTPCDEARLALWPDPARPARAAARAHLDQCPKCQHFFRVQEALGRRLARITRDRAPDALRERVLVAVAGARLGGRRKVWIALGFAAAAGLAIAIGLRGPGVDGLAMPVVARVSEALPLDPTYLSNDLDQVREWLAGQVGGDVHLPDITGAVITGGRVADLDGRPTATAIYEMHGMPVTYFVISTAGAQLTEAAGIRSGRTNGWEVAVWAEAGGLRALAAPMPRDEVYAIAKECRDKATAL